MCIVSHYLHIIGSCILLAVIPKGSYPKKKNENHLPLSLRFSLTLSFSLSRGGNFRGASSLRKLFTPCGITYAATRGNRQWRTTVTVRCTLTRGPPFRIQTESLEYPVPFLRDALSLRLPAVWFSRASSTRRRFNRISEPHCFHLRYARRVSRCISNVPWDYVNEIILRRRDRSVFRAVPAGSQRVRGAPWK